MIVKTQKICYCNIWQLPTQNKPSLLNNNVSTEENESAYFGLRIFVVCFDRNEENVLTSWFCRENFWQMLSSHNTVSQVNIDLHINWNEPSVFITWTK